MAQGPSSPRIAQIPNPVVPTPSREELLGLFRGRRPEEIQTPHLVVERARFVENCKRMAEAVERLDGWDFRAHIKTHKTPQGTALQARHTRTSRIIVSTLPELRAILDAGLVDSGLVNDILYSMPPAVRLLDTLKGFKARVEESGATLRLLVDSVEQIQHLGTACGGDRGVVWSVFLKLDIGTRRAGLPPDSDEMQRLIEAALRSPHISLFGTYAHAGFSYASRDGASAAEYLAREVAGVNEAARRVLETAGSLGLEEKLPRDARLVLAVGATPTAHAAGPVWDEARRAAGVSDSELVGRIELHAGNYPLLDEQQTATNLVRHSDVAISVGATIISAYPQRGEALCDAGAIAMSKDVGPHPGYGPVVRPESMARQGWVLARTSQEHGIIAPALPGTGAGAGVGGGGEDDGRAQDVSMPKIGQYVQIVPQHACLTVAQHPWLLVVGEDGLVDDVWVPCKGW